MPNQVRASLDQSLAQTGQCPFLYGLGSSQRPQEVGEVVDQRMKLKPDSIGSKLHAGKPRPLDRVFAFFDMLFCCAAPIVEGQYTFIG